MESEQADAPVQLEYTRYVKNRSVDIGALVVGSLSAGLSLASFVFVPILVAAGLRHMPFIALAAVIIMGVFFAAFGVVAIRLLRLALGSRRSTHYNKG